MAGARSRRYSSLQVVVALACAFGFGIAAGALFKIAWQIRDSKVRADNAAAAYEQSASVEANHSCGYLTGADKAYCYDRAFRRARDEERQEYELQAEREQAIWAGASGKTAIFGEVFSVVTIVALFLAFIEQRRSNRISYLGLVDARRRARQTISETRRLGEAQTRAYLSVTDCSVIFGKGVPSLRPTIRNAGQSPALRVKWHAQLSFMRETGEHFRTGETDPELI